MKYAEVVRMTERCEIPISRFLVRNELVCQQAGPEDPVFWLADQFLPEADIHESYEDWIVRQVQQILLTTLLSDTMAGQAHVARKVVNIRFDERDKEYLVRTLGNHPRVREVWGSLIEMPEAAAA